MVKHWINQTIVSKTDMMAVSTVKKKSNYTKILFITILPQNKCLCGKTMYRGDISSKNVVNFKLRNEMLVSFGMKSG